MNLQNTTDMQRKYFKQNGIINCKQENICPRFIFTPFCQLNQGQGHRVKKLGKFELGKFFFLFYMYMYLK